jgi:hypothetical protein
VKLIIQLKWWFIKLLLGGLTAYFFFVTWEEVSRGKFVNAGFYQDGVSNLFLAIVLAGIPSVVIGVPLLMVLKAVMFNDEERVFEKVQELRRFDGPPQPAPPAPRRTD